MPPSCSRRDILRLTTAGLSLGTAGCVSTETQPSTVTSATSEARTPQTDRRSPIRESTTVQPAASPSTAPAETTRPAESTSTPPVTPFADARASPAPTCRDGYTSLDPFWVVGGSGPFRGFELSVANEAIAFGDTLTATLTNVSDEEKLTGSKQQCDIEYRTENGWHTIFGMSTEQSWTDEPFIHQPGEGFEWSLRFTQDGLTNSIEYQESTYYVCVPLKSGTYRFVYWGFVDDTGSNDPSQTQDAIGYPFSVSEN